MAEFVEELALKIVAFLWNIGALIGSLSVWDSEWNQPQKRTTMEAFQPMRNASQHRDKTVRRAKSFKKVHN